MNLMLKRMTFEGRDWYLSQVFTGQPLLVAVHGFGQSVLGSSSYWSFDRMSGLAADCAAENVNLVFPESGSWNWSSRDVPRVVRGVQFLMRYLQLPSVVLAGFSDGAMIARECAVQMQGSTSSPRGLVLWSGLWPSQMRAKLPPTLLVSTEGETLTAFGTWRAERWFRINGLQYERLRVRTASWTKHRWVSAANGTILSRVRGWS
jgi:pimeloyl-ACP methyl ester carboxylesterase